MPDALTLRQREILEFITSFIQDRGYPPTLREIGEHWHPLHQRRQRSPQGAGEEGLPVPRGSPSRAPCGPINGGARGEPGEGRGQVIPLRKAGATEEGRRGRRADHRPGRRRLADPGRGERRGHGCASIASSWAPTAGGLRAARGRRVDDRGRHPRRRLRVREEDAHGPARRHRGRDDRGGGHGQALLPGGGPHPLRARELEHATHRGQEAPSSTPWISSAWWWGCIASSADELPARARLRPGSHSRCSASTPCWSRVRSSY